MPPSPITDEQLGNRLLLGEVDAVALIYERYKHDLYFFCLKVLSDRDNAEDAVHETMVKVLHNGKTLHNPLSLKSWLFTIARNESFSILRKKHGIRAINEEDENVFTEESAADSIQTDDRALLIESLLDQLHPVYKEVIVLREYQSLRYDEIAAITGSTVSSVKSRIFKARKALLKKLQPLRKVGAL